MAAAVATKSDLQNSQVNENISTTTATPRSQQKAEQWVIDVIGKFLLEIYHKKIISRGSEWEIQKQRMRQEYNKFINASAANLEFLRKINSEYGALNIGNLLHRTGFLLDTPRECNYYRIRWFQFNEYRKGVLKALDERCLNGEKVNYQANANAQENPENQKINLNLEPTYEVDEDAAIHNLVFEGARTIRTDEDFELTNIGCYICQINFETHDEFEEHVVYHSDDSDFNSLLDMDKDATNVFNMTYQMCKKSHFFCFKMHRNDDADVVRQCNAIIIDKIIIVQSRSMYYVNNKRVPYELPDSGMETFFVDSHLFARYLEQPIVIVFHYEDYPHKRYIEQHHFMRNEEFPTLMMAVNPRHLPSKKLFKSKIKIQQYLPEVDIRKAAKRADLLPYVLTRSNEFSDYYQQGKCLSLYNYRQALFYLLQMEDIDSLNEYFKLTQRNVTLRKYEDGYSFQIKNVPNISVEQIASLYDEVIVYGDNSDFIKNFSKQNNAGDSCDILLQNDDDICRNNKKDVFFGMIQNISNGRITFVCDSNIQIALTYTIIIRPNRLDLRYQYRALEMIDQMPASDVMRVLFPSNIPPMVLDTSRFSMILNNIQIYDNPEQMQAVKYIAYGPRHEAPYIIHGPPGTGKTTTLVEAILQLYYKRRDTKILVTAGSNSACDEVALRLCRVLSKTDETRAIVRIYSRANERRSDNIDELLLEYSNMYTAQFYPDVSVLHEYRIVVCTLSVVGKLSTGKFGKTEDGKGVFTHIIFDEVAASTETETLMGLMGTLTSRTCIIMAGDHKQLGAVLKSETAQSLGLGKSIMERLIERDCYSYDATNRYYDPSIQTRLVRNHRSHPKIVELYNNLFYDGRLIPGMSHADHPHCEQWSGAPNNAFPIIFHSVFGHATRGETVSLSNQQELDVVMDYVKDFMYFGINGLSITEADIGIISPYKRQYLRIQEELNLRNWYGIETGSAETFQGREKAIIIVSFVRSFTPTIGFLDNMRRLNVVLSRAKSLLILIGNPKTLSLNAEFKSIIELCIANKTLIGSRFFEIDANGNVTLLHGGGDAGGNAAGSTASPRGPKNKQNSRAEERVRKWRENNAKNGNQRRQAGVQEGSNATASTASPRGSTNKQATNTNPEQSPENNAKNGNNQRPAQTRRQQNTANNNNNKKNDGIKPHERRQPMKNSAANPGKNGAQNWHKHRQQQRKNKRDSDEASTSSTRATNSAATSVASSMQDVSHIDDYFHNLPSLHNNNANVLKKLNATKSTEAFNEAELIARAKKLNLINDSFTTNTAATATAQSQQYQQQQQSNKKPPSQSPLRKKNQAAAVKTIFSQANNTHKPMQQPTSGGVNNANAAPAKPSQANNTHKPMQQSTSGGVNNANAAPAKPSQANITHKPMQQSTSGGVNNANVAPVKPSASAISLTPFAGASTSAYRMATTTPSQTTASSIARDGSTSANVTKQPSTEPGTGALPQSNTARNATLHNVRTIDCSTGNSSNYARPTATTHHALLRDGDPYNRAQSRPSQAIGFYAIPNSTFEHRPLRPEPKNATKNNCNLS